MAAAPEVAMRNLAAPATPERDDPATLVQPSAEPQTSTLQCGTTATLPKAAASCAKQSLSTSRQTGHATHTVRSRRDPHLSRVNVSQVLFISANVAPDQAPIDVEAEGRAISHDVSDETRRTEIELTQIESASLPKLIDKLPALEHEHSFRIVHFGCHGGLDFSLRTYVNDHLHRTGADLPQHRPSLGNSEKARCEKFMQLCAKDIRTVCESDGLYVGRALSSHGLLDTPVDFRLLESFESGIVLHDDLAACGHRTIRPDGLAGLFAPSTQMIGHANLLSSRSKSSWCNLECVIFNSCCSYLMASEFLKSTGVRYAVCMAGRISDKAGIKFTRSFYAALPYDGVESAWAKGMAAINAELKSEERDRLVEGMHLIPNPLNRPESPERSSFGSSSTDSAHSASRSNTRVSFVLKFETKASGAKDIIDEIRELLKVEQFELPDDCIKSSTVSEVDVQLRLDVQSMDFDGANFTEKDAQLLVDDLEMRLNDDSYLNDITKIGKSKLRYVRHRAGSVILEVACSPETAKRLPALMSKTFAGASADAEPLQLVEPPKQLAASVTIEHAPMELLNQVNALSSRQRSGPPRPWPPAPEPTPKTGASGVSASKACPGVTQHTWPGAVPQRLVSGAGSVDRLNQQAVLGHNSIRDNLAARRPRLQVTGVLEVHAHPDEAAKAAMAAVVPLRAAAATATFTNNEQLHQVSVQEEPEREGCRRCGAKIGDDPILLSFRQCASCEREHLRCRALEAS